LSKVTVYLPGGETMVYEGPAMAFSTRVGSELYIYDGGAVIAVYAPHAYDHVEVQENPLPPSLRR
jgi:hypothetical protein